MSFVNPHPVKDGIGKLCPWCDGTGLYASAAPLSGTNHHPGCLFMVGDDRGGQYPSSCDGKTKWVPCGYCKGTGRTA